jgi:triacylglycerol esterase/lipase EstA (alpha/beta hydrolase family)
MLARWIRLLLAAEIVLYSAVAWRCHAAGWEAASIMALIVLLALLWRVSHAAGSFLIAAWKRGRDHRSLPWRTSAQALWGEFLARLVSYNWSQAFPAWAVGADPTGRHDGTPILLVHGYFSNRGMWIQCRQRLGAAGLGPVYTITLEPIMGSIDAMVPSLAARIGAICRETGRPRIHIVAHSMGGLVTRAYMATHGAALIARLVTLGSPHAGTEMAGFGVGTCTREMRVGSDWLQTLADLEEADDAAKPPTVSIYTVNDDLVYPPESAVLPWATNVPVAGVGHVGLLFSSNVARRVIDALR